MKKLLPLAIAALFAAGSAHAGGLDVCEVESDYDLKIGQDALTFSRESGTPANVEMRGGQLFVDGTKQVLSAADTRRIEQFERDIRALVPEVKGIALEAVGIATEAVLQVATAFVGDAQPQSLKRLEQLGANISHRIEVSADTAEWRDDEFDAAIAELTAELVPMIVGDITAAAVSAALSGDADKVAEIEARAEQLEKEIDTRVEARADALEARAETLCPRVIALDQLESELELRLGDGSTLDLVQAEPRSADKQ